MCGSLTSCDVTQTQIPDAKLLHENCHKTSSKAYRFSGAQLSMAPNGKSDSRRQPCASRESAARAQTPSSAVPHARRQHTAGRNWPHSDSYAHMSCTASRANIHKGPTRHTRQHAITYSPTPATGGSTPRHQSSRSGSRASCPKTTGAPRGPDWLAGHRLYTIRSGSIRTR